MQLVPLLCEMHPAQLRPRPPPPERLVQVQHRDVRKVRHARDRLEDPEALDRPARVQEVERDAEREVKSADRERGLVVSRSLLSGLFAPPDGGVVEGERGELLADRRDGARDLLLLPVRGVVGRRSGSGSRRGDFDQVFVGGDGPVLCGRRLELRQHARGLESDVRGERGLGEGFHGGDRSHPEGRLGRRRLGTGGAEADGLAEGLELLLEVCPSL